MIRSFEGKTPRIAESAFVSEAAYVVGDVEIGEHSAVWPGAVIRGDFAPIRIGSNTMIEDNSVLHTGAPMTIGDRVTIGHGVVVHGKKIGNNNLVGNHATLLENSQIGDFCVIAAGCLVPPGMVVPDHSFVVGVPGRVKGRVSEALAERLKRGPVHYVELARRYKRQGL